MTTGADVVDHPRFRAGERRLHATLDLLRDAGHAPWLDELQRCATSVADFLGRGTEQAS